MLNIVAGKFQNIHFYKFKIGIIIDTFKSLREDLKKYLNDLESFCFICGYDSETIEKNTDSNTGIRKFYYLTYQIRI